MFVGWPKSPLIIQQAPIFRRIEPSNEPSEIVTSPDPIGLSILSHFAKPIRWFYVSEYISSVDYSIGVPASTRILKYIVVITHRSYM